MKKILTFLLLILISGCSFNTAEETISVTISDMDQSYVVESQTGITVDQLLRDNNISINPLDKTSPPLSTPLAGGELILITRVTEEFSVVESILSFEQQTIKNESLSQGQTVLIQSGVNGRKQSTFRVLYENGEEVSRTLVKEEIIQEAKPEILMIGVQSPFSPLAIDGVIAYISSANAWIMDVNTGNRRIVISTGDLDGRIFTISYDQRWLLFSRSSSDGSDENINSIWLLDLNDEDATPISTGIRNVVHYADWVPGRNRVFAYSTVEPRATAPGWQANNDLHLYKFDTDGVETDDTTVVESNSGGIYGWWGTTYQWSPNGNLLAYARPDSIGLVNIETGEMEGLLDFEPYQPKTDWAWVPGIQWSLDGSTIYTVQAIHSNNNDSAANYSLVAFLIENRRLLPLVENCGLFCYPVPSNYDTKGDFQVGYLSAILPEQSETSRYSLYVMDRDGSNKTKLYPGEGQQGLDPQLIGWSPSVSDESTNTMIFLAQGNIYFMEISTYDIKQITGDGSISKVTWR